jgi:hypothetical protein
MVRQIFTVAMLAFASANSALAGGPKYVAGSTYFNASSMGQPITWPLGAINYYTDQGNLSPILPNAAANSLVANAFTQWTSVPGAALTATNAGQLAEDVNGSNIQVNSSGIITAPADITPDATQTPVGIVYDYDGSVTDALLGEGAGDSSQCFWNAVYGGDDNFSTEANFSHALVVINGQCALQSSQLTDVEYRLVRVLGSVIGMGWSQNNLNVVTGRPPPTLADKAGFPVMHYMDLDSCVPITVCYANPYQLADDDVAALSRLYPASSAGSSVRIYGSVYFVSRSGAAAQPMQGVNVVAQWIDPSTGQPSTQYSASSVSGFVFTGNAGNPITGLANPLGILYSQFGSSNQSVEGFFDLGGLPNPNGASAVQYQISVETIDPLWSAGVGPYISSQVAPSGTFEPIIVTVSAGGEAEQNILMSNNAQAVPSWAVAETWSAPATVPTAGDWVGSLSGYGDVGYFLVAAQANRTLSVAVTSLDETGAASESKAAPVVGMWTLGDPQGTPPPAFTPAPFNSETFGLTRLDAQVFTSNSFVIGIADVRGDGRPDYHYHAHILYGNAVTPGRIPVKGAAILLEGIGFEPGLTVAVGSINVPVLATGGGQMLIAAPAQSDGLQNITISDPVSGAASIMTNSLTVGAAASDTLTLLQGKVNPPTPVGTQAVDPVTVQALASDGVTPVNGATIGWSTTNGATLSACSGATSCSVITDETGLASTWVTPGATGNATITAALAPAVYSPPQSVSAPLTATSTSLDLGVTTPYLWIASGASLSVPLTARVVDLGNPDAGATVTFRIAQGTGSLSAASAVTNSSGYASVNLTLTNFTTSFQISVCVANGNPCQPIYGNAVAASMLNLQAVAGESQVVSGTVFQPLEIRVIDSSTPPNPILGANVLFQSTVSRPLGDDSILLQSDPGAAQTGMNVVLSVTQITLQSDVNGLASFSPSTGSYSGPLEVVVQISAGTVAALQEVMEAYPGSSGMNSSPAVTGTGKRFVSPLTPPVFVPRIEFR